MEVEKTSDDRLLVQLAQTPSDHNTSSYPIQYCIGRQASAPPGLASYPALHCLPEVATKAALRIIQSTQQSTIAMPPKLGVAAKRVVKELKEVEKELPEGIRCVRILSRSVLSTLPADCWADRDLPIEPA